jgi:hypothetical protein
MEYDDDGNTFQWEIKLEEELTKDEGEELLALVADVIASHQYSGPNPQPIRYRRNI